MKRLRSVLTLFLLTVVAMVAAPLAHADDDHPTWRVQRYEQQVVLDRAGTAAVRLDLYFDFANDTCLLYTSPSPRDGLLSRMPSSA